LLKVKYLALMTKDISLKMALKAQHVDMTPRKMKYIYSFNKIVKYIV